MNHLPVGGNAGRLWPVCYLESTPLKRSFLLRENPVITDALHQIDESRAPLKEQVFMRLGFFPLRYSPTNVP